MRVRLPSRAPFPGAACALAFLPGGTRSGVPESPRPHRFPCFSLGRLWGSTPSVAARAPSSRQRNRPFPRTGSALPPPPSRAGRCGGAGPPPAPAAPVQARAGGAPRICPSRAVQTQRGLASVPAVRPGGMKRPRVPAPRDERNSRFWLRWGAWGPRPRGDARTSTPPAGAPALLSR